MIAELEKPLQVVPFKVGEDYSLIVPENRTSSEELAAWKKLFRGQSPEVVFKHVEGLEKFFVQTSSALEDSKSKDNLATLSAEVTKSAEVYLNLAKQAGDASGLGLFITPVASIVGVGGAVTHGFVVAGGKVYQETLNVGAKHIEHHADNVRQVTEKVLDNTRSVVESGMKIFDVGGAATNIASSLGESISSTEKVKAETSARIAEAEAKARVEQMEALEKQLEDLKKEREKQIKELKEEKEKAVEKLEERIKRKDDRIDNLEKRIRELEEKVEKAQDRLYVHQTEELAKSRSSSPVPPSTHYGNQ